MNFLMRLKFVLFCALFVVLFSGCAWADEYKVFPRTTQNILAEVVVGGKVDYSASNVSSKIRNSNTGFRFEIFKIGPQNTLYYGRPQDLPENGTATLTPTKAMTVSFQDSNGKTVRTSVYPANQQAKFNLILRKSNGAYYLYDTDNSGLSAVIDYDESGNNETALSKAAYSSIMTPYHGEGVLGEIKRTVKEHLASKCVPYLEITKDASGEKMTGVKYRFVNPDTLKTAQDTDIVIAWDFITLSDGSVIEGNIDVDYKGTDYEKTINPPISISDIKEIGFGFYYKSVNPVVYTFPDNWRIATNGEIGYSRTITNWRFAGDFTGSAISGDHKPPVVSTPSSADVDRAKAAAAANLKEMPTEFKAAQSAYIKTNTLVVFDSSGNLKKDYTSSAISIAQDVAPGGAIVPTSAKALQISPLNR